MNNKLIALAVALFLVIGGSFAGFLIYNQPKNAAIDATAKTLEDFMEREEFDFALSTLKNGSVAFDVKKLQSEDEEGSEDLLEGITASGKLYFGDKKLYLDEFSFKRRESKLEGSAYISDKMFYVSEQRVLKGAYGANLDNLAKQFKNSIFAYGADSDYAIEDEDTFNSIVRALENPTDKSFERDAEKLVERVTKDIWKIVVENAEFESSTDKVKLNDTRKKLRVITITVDGDAISEIIKSVYEYLCDSEDIVEFLEEHGESFAFSLGVEEDQTVAEFYEEFLEDAEDKIDELCDNAEDEIDEELTVKIATPKLRHKMLKLSVEYDGENLVDIDFGKDGAKKSDSIALEIYEEKATFKINQNDRKAYKAVLEFGAYDVDINVDRSYEKYSVKVVEKYSSSEYSYLFRGTLAAKRGTVEMSLDKIILEAKYDASSYYRENTVDNLDCDISIIAKKRERMPDVPDDYKTIDKLRDEDLEKIISSLTNVSQTYADKVNAAYNNNAPYSYAKICVDLSNEIDCTSSTGSRRGTIVAANGYSSLYDIETDIRAGKDIKGIVITVSSGSAIKAEYRELTYADLK